MQRDFRSTAEFAETAAFYESLFLPGTDHVSSVADYAASPDGKTAYFTGRSFPAALEAGPSTRLYRLSLKGGEVALLSHAAARLPRPSPDGRVLCYVVASETGAGDSLVFHPLASAQGRLQVQIDGLIEQVRWSADGGRLLLVVAGLGADLAGYQGGYATAPTGGEGPEWLPQVSTGGGDAFWRRLWVYDCRSGALRQVSRPHSNIWEASWCGEHIAVIASGDHSEGSWYQATLNLLDPASGEERVLYASPDQMALPEGSPDGKAVAFVEAVSSDRGILCGTLRTVPAAGGGASTVNTRSVEVSHLAWVDADRLHFTGQTGFFTVVGEASLKTGAVTELWRSTDFSCGEWNPISAPLPGARALIVAEAYNHPPMLAVVGDGGLEIVRVFASEGALKAASEAAPAEPVSWTAPDGLEIQGWLVRPAGDKPAPLVLDIHGGPVWASRNRWLARTRATPLLVRHGCAVLYPNPRGSSGRGQDFARLVKGDMGGADTLDFIAAVDHLIAAGVADEARLACTGSSYGGFMSSVLVTRDRRFAAAAPISPVTDWFSQHRTSQIPYFDELFLDGSASDPNGLFFQRSPAMFADKVRTPTLILAGALDKNTPPGQAQEFFQSLLEHGVETALVMYPQDGHSLRGYPAYIDSAARILAWFGQHLRL
ncbi:MAG TPA: prolyl oligopeptidase family serine peptidase [Caulobacteraceae bacterium]|jgi:dipeptidyl aminopeptidase/acylaminoacyl peptidase